MRYLITVILLSLFFFTSFGHVELFNINDGILKPNQPINKQYSFEIQTHKTFFIDEIGIDFYNVGDDDSANIRIEIFLQNKLVYAKKSTIYSIYNQIAYLKINFLLFQDKSYVIQIIDEDLEKNKITDNSIGLFTPNTLPIKETNNYFSTTQIFSSIYSKYPFDTATECPFVHFGTTKQNGILFSETEGKIEYNKFSETIFNATTFKILNPTKNLYIDSIGLNYLDTGSDSKSTLKFELKDSISNSLIWKLDTTIYNIHKSPISFPINTKLENKSYILSLVMDEINNFDDNVLYYKPNKIPYTDNLEKMNVTSLLSKKNINENYIIDTIGLPFLISYKDELLNTKRLETNKHSITLVDNKLNIQNNDYIQIELIELSGKSIFEYKNIVPHTEIELTTIQTGIYILRTLDKNGNLNNYMIQKY